MKINDERKCNPKLLLWSEVPAGETVVWIKRDGVTQGSLYLKLTNGAGVALADAEVFSNDAMLVDHSRPSYKIVNAEIIIKE